MLSGTTAVYIVLMELSLYSSYSLFIVPCFLFLLGLEEIFAFFEVGHHILKLKKKVDLYFALLLMIQYCTRNG